jgi:hypothetical protein
MNKYKYIAIVSVFLLITAFSVSARGVYQTNNEFLTEVFNNQVPKSQVIWLKGDVKETINTIMGEPYKGLRIRYWQAENRSAWILEDIGKEQPITFGIVIKDNKIEQIKVLAFRESRGYEVRYPAFQQQFIGAHLNGLELDRNIDGISGATLSVWAMTDVIRLALYLDFFSCQ